MSDKRKSLFYPSCGDDLVVPLECFKDEVECFWFVDINNRRNNPLSSPHGFSALRRVSARVLQGTTIRDKSEYTVKVTTYTCIRETDGRTLEINICEGRGYDAFRSIFDDLGEKLAVFFYRGDSPGESGSGFFWLERPRLSNVLNRLIEDGLIVSDGSNAMSKLSQYHNQRNLEEADLDTLIAKMMPFDFTGWRFTCIDQIGMRYGPTFIWKVSTIPTSTDVTSSD